ncbi:MAG TPA: hypothetical protein HA256_02675 [Methanoregulaceae archaeon]|nr:hypothetical protein [Methanoregulaceae archaeon]
MTETGELEKPQDFLRETGIRHEEAGGIFILLKHESGSDSKKILKDIILRLQCKGQVIAVSA